MKKADIKSAVVTEIDRLTEQIDLLSSVVKSLNVEKFKLSVPFNLREVELLLSKSEFNGSGVYIISFEKAVDAPILIKQLENYRNGRLKTKENSYLKEAVVRPNGNDVGTTLYVGKIRSMNFRRRLRQHLLGDQNHRTTAIRLNKWLNKSGPKVLSKKVTISLVPVTEDKLVRALEKAIWNHRLPILGDL